MIIQLKVVIFVVASAGFAWLTRSSLRSPGSHGFHRFFAWEAILALILLNIDDWFYKPFGFPQIVAWILLTIGSILAVCAANDLRKLGKPDSRRNDSSLISIEKTTKLITVGTYRYIRHPLYSSLLFLNWGVFFKRLSWTGVALALVATFFLTMTAKVEETENIRYFGDAYKRYMKHTRMFIPLLF